MDSASERLRFGIGQRLVLGLLGAGSFGGGTVAVFKTENGTGTGVLLAFGGVVLVLAILGSRIEALEFGGAKLRLRAAAAEKFILAEHSDRLGNVAEAERLRAQAHALLDAAGPLASEYRLVRDSMQAGPERTRQMEEVVGRARQLAKEQPFDREEVVGWLREGTDEQRITALAMMQAKTELRDFDAVLNTIEHSRSAFEQYHALLLATRMIDELGPRQRTRLASVVRAVRGLRFRPDTNRWQLGEEILRRIQDV